MSEPHRVVTYGWNPDIQACQPLIVRKCASRTSGSTRFTARRIAPRARNRLAGGNALRALKPANRSTAMAGGNPGARVVWSATSSVTE